MATQKNHKKEILSKYMEYVLEKGKPPKSIYQFSKELGIEESTFYNFYSSFDAIAYDVYGTFYDETYLLISKDETFETLDTKNKLLVFYYTFFELLTANRSYILITLKEHKNILDKLKTLQHLKEKFKDFVHHLEIETIDLKKEELNKTQQKGIENLAWTQLLMTLKFWIEDTSPAFEKTDLFIEKSVNASFDLLNTTPIKSLIDFGKFFFKEKIKPNL